MNNDFEAYKEALTQFVEAKDKQGQNPRKSYFASLGHLDPIDKALNRTAEIEFEQSFLNGDERKRLQVARDYASTLHDLGRKWWWDVKAGK